MNQTKPNCGLQGKLPCGPRRPQNKIVYTERKDGLEKYYNLTCYAFSTYRNESEQVVQLNMLCLLNLIQ